MDGKPAHRLYVCVVNPEQWDAHLRVLISGSGGKRSDDGIEVNDEFRSDLQPVPQRRFGLERFRVAPAAVCSCSSQTTPPCV